MTIENIEVKDFSKFKACAFLMPIAGGAPEDEEKEKETQVEEEEAGEEGDKEKEKEKESESEEEEAEEEESEEGSEEEESEEDPDATEEEGAEEEEDEEGEPKRKGSFDGILQNILSEIRGLKNGAGKESADEKEWTLDELDNVEQRIDKGELSPKYRRFVAEKRSELISERTAKKHMARVEFNGKWAESRANAKKDFPELKNPKSDLFKLSAQFVNEDPAYQRYLAAAAKNPNVNAGDFGLDPDLQYKCAQRALGVLKQKESARPKSKPLAKDGLEGGGRSVATLKSTGKAELDKLEALAVKTGNQNDWRNYFAKRERYLKGLKK